MLESLHKNFKSSGQKYHQNNFSSGGNPKKKYSTIMCISGSFLRTFRRGMGFWWAGWGAVAAAHLGFAERKAFPIVLEQFLQEHLLSWVVYCNFWMHFWCNLIVRGNLRWLAESRPERWCLNLFRSYGSQSIDRQNSLINNAFLLQNQHCVRFPDDVCFFRFCFGKLRSATHPLLFGPFQTFELKVCSTE